MKSECKHERLAILKMVGRVDGTVSAIYECMRCGRVFKEWASELPKQSKRC